MHYECDNMSKTVNLTILTVFTDSLKIQSNPVKLLINTANIYEKTCRPTFQDKNCYF